MRPVLASSLPGKWGSAESSYSGALSRTHRPMGLSVGKIVGMANSGETSHTLNIDVLLHEYDALRAEILARANSRFQLLGLAGVIGALLGAKNLHGYDILWISLALLGVAALIWIVFRMYINRCAARVSQIEIEINQAIDHTTLKWESHPLPHSWRDLFKSTNRSVPPGGTTSDRRKSDNGDGRIAGT
jgi:hypothetical protein